MLKQISLPIMILLVAVAVISGTPAVASCASSTSLSTTRIVPSTDPLYPDPTVYTSFVWTGGIFSPYYFEDYAPLEIEPPYTGNLRSFFWQLGAGDPAAGSGVDSGTFDLVVSTALSYGYSPPAYGRTFPIYYAAELNADWASAGVDGCVAADSCICTVFVDREDPSSYLAAVGSLTDASGNATLDLDGEDPIGNALPVVLRPIESPRVTDVVTQGTTGVDVTLEVPARRAGIYNAVGGDSCDCAPIEYLVYETVLSRNDSAPLSRDPADWVLATPSGGGAQMRTAVDTPFVATTDCSAGDSDVYYAVVLFFDSGFSTEVLSGNSIAVECGSNFSDPYGEVRPGPARSLGSRGGKSR